MVRLNCVSVGFPWLMAISSRTRSITNDSARIRARITVTLETTSIVGFMASHSYRYGCGDSRCVRGRMDRYALELFDRRPLCLRDLPVHIQVLALLERFDG